MPTLPSPLEFSLDLLPMRVDFGIGRSLALPRHLDALGIERPLLVGTPSAATRHRDLAARLADRTAANFFDAAPHCPVEVVEACRRAYLDADCDGVIAIGGGSSLGLGKILAAEQHAVFVALPTTYSGSEMTSLFGRKIGREKRVGRDPRCRPALTIYDAALTRDLPRAVAAASGMNSVAHAVEALYPQTPNPLALLLAEQALRAHRHGLVDVTSDRPSDEGRSAAQYGGWLGGWLVQLSGIALHHQLCHVLGGLFDLPHGASNAVVLPHAFAYNAPAVPDARALLERVLETDHAARGLYDFARTLGAPASLAELGMPADGIAATVEAMLAHGGYNPRALEREALTRLVEDAYAGRRP